MFSILLQRNDSEKNKLDKELTTIATVTGELKAETSIIDPVIVVAGDFSSFATVNYMTIVVFKRSYFVTNVRSIRNGLVEFSCHVDVLTSFATEIRSNTAIIKRQENEWNLYLNDSVIRCYQNPIVSTHAFPSGFSGNSYVLLLAGTRGIGIDVGAGGFIAGDGDELGGTGNTGSKTSAGLVQYAFAQLGRPYWYGTFGNTSSAILLGQKRRQYPDMYDVSIVGGEAFEDQYDKRVHDCVGLIKGYRWSDTGDSSPTYVPAEDVDVRGLYGQCTRKTGTVVDSSGTGIPTGAVLFYANMQHCGVYIGNGRIIEARGHRYGVVMTTLAGRTDFALWGIPDWMQGVPASTITSAPKITTDPYPVIVEAGQMATFTVVATSPYAEMTYQWQYSDDQGVTWTNSGYSTATNATLRFTAAARFNGYQYRCVVSNIYGSTESAGAFLTVTS